MTHINSKLFRIKLHSVWQSVFSAKEGHLWIIIVCIIQSFNAKCGSSISGSHELWVSRIIHLLAPLFCGWAGVGEGQPMVSRRGSGMPSKAAWMASWHWPEEVAKLGTFPIVCLTFVLADPHPGQMFLLFQFRRLLIKQTMIYLVTEKIAYRGQTSKGAMDQKEKPFSSSLPCGSFFACAYHC